MWKQIPVFAAVLTLCACGSAPTIKYPSGSAARVAINASAPAIAAPSMRQAAPLQGTTGARAVPARVVVSGPPPAPIPLSLYFINATEQSTLSVMRRWARAARIDFSWESAVDYPITPAMREIVAPDLAGALSQVRTALEGVEEPLEIVLGEQGLVVKRLDPTPIATPTEVVVDAAMGASVAPAAAVAVTPAPNDPAPVNPSSASAAVPATAAADAGAVAPQLSATTAPSQAPEKKWTVASERSLREIVSKWASLEGVEVRWESSKDFPVGDSVRIGTYEGDFRHALGLLASQFSFVETPLGIRFLERGTVLKVYDLADQT